VMLSLCGFHFCEVMHCARSPGPARDSRCAATWRTDADEDLAVACADATCSQPTVTVARRTAAQVRRTCRK
jgi:hypothetical protein